MTTILTTIFIITAFLIVLANSESITDVILFAIAVILWIKL